MIFWYILAAIGVAAVFGWIIPRFILSSNKPQVDVELLTNFFNNKIDTIAEMKQNGFIIGGIAINRYRPVDSMIMRYVSSRVDVFNEEDCQFLWTLYEKFLKEQQNKNKKEL